MKEQRHILITGASSGLGAALARFYAGPGVLLSLTGRAAERLAATAACAESKGASVRMACLDVTDTAALTAWIEACDAVTPLDLVIANAGISAGTAEAYAETVQQASQIFAVNLTGAVQTVLTAQRLMLPRGRGQLALVSSVAGFFPLAGAPAYSASKGALRQYGLALRAALKGTGLRVNVVCPGFVRTPMTDRNTFPMPFLIDADQAAAATARGLAADRAVIVFPAPMAGVARLLRLLPEKAVAALSALLPEKSAF